MPAPTFLIAVLLLFLGFVPAASTQAHFVADSASAACSTVTSDTNAWQQVTTHHGVTLKLPPHFVEKHYAVTIGTVTSQEWRDGLGASVTIDVGGGPKELTKAGVIPHDKNFAYS